MTKCSDNQKKPSGSFRKLLQERIEKANPRRELTAGEAKRLTKLEVIADRLKRGENVQNRQLQTWLSEDEYAQVDIEWQEQLELREELKDKPGDLIFILSNLAGKLTVLISRYLSISSLLLPFR